MAISYVGGLTDTADATVETTTSLTGLGLLENDFVICAVAADLGVDSSDIISTGWTVVRDNPAGHNPSGWVVTKRMGSSPDTAFVWDPPDDTALVMKAFRGVDTTTALDVATVILQGFFNNPNCPAITPITDGAMILAIGLLDDDAVSDSTAPTGYTTDFLAQEHGPTAGADGATVQFGHMLQSTAAVEDPGAFSSSGEDTWWAVTMALRPAAVAATQQPMSKRWGGVPFAPGRRGVW